MLRCARCEADPNPLVLAACADCRALQEFAQQPEPLPAPAPESARKRQRERPRGLVDTTELERRLTAIEQRLLALESVGSDDA